jgi:hypothetical protein
MKSSLPFGKAILCACRRGLPLSLHFHKSLCYGIVTLLVLSSSQAFGQDQFWVKLTEKEGVEIYVNYDQCQQVALKFLNKNDYSVQVEWSEAAYNHGTEASTPLSDGNNKTLRLSANGTSAGDCDSDTENVLIVDTSSISETLGDGIADLHIENLKVTQD